jgi:methionyl-tRNA formyltransferase
MNPWPVAHCRLGEETLRILKAVPLPGVGRPGVIEQADVRDLVVGTGDGLLSIIELQPPGKRPMSAAAFLQGRRLLKGHTLR